MVEDTYAVGLGGYNPLEAVTGWRCPWLTYITPCLYIEGRVSAWVAMSDSIPHGWAIVQLIREEGVGPPCTAA